MDCTSTRLAYRQTNAFSNIILDYLDHAESLKPFYLHSPDITGIKAAMEARKNFNGDRKVLVQQLRAQYEGMDLSARLGKNIASLSSADTFTITTAHQNNIFTGPLYFIYKIIHAIRLADELNSSLAPAHFVPVFYIGSEDADLDELNHITLDGEKLVWNTKQKGAVGRMKIDEEVVKLIDRIESQLAVEPFGKEIVDLVRKHYHVGADMQGATFQMVHSLFAEYGLIVLLPDNPAQKKLMLPVFEDDLLHQAASTIVEQTANALDKSGYKVQANPREINLFYLQDDIRERIMKQGEGYKVHGTSLQFTREEMNRELQVHPERFSPNVILRGLYQETILPDVAFIGGGGEVAYWLQLKELFRHYKVPYPVLVLRNSFLVIESKWQEKMEKLGLGMQDIFLKETEIFNRLVAKETDKKLKLNGTLSQAESLYETIKQQAGSIDVTLERHVEALKLKTVHRLEELEKKMLRAEKRKYGEQQRKIHAIKSQLFPGDGLQERVENLMSCYAKWGVDFIHKIYEASPALEQEFVVLLEKQPA
ncbi:MAG TPA: bacillithiol biosynthesis cysteine-adding enzyme BshC [Chitinophagaceae bacterium]|nr:bacillithiol biosynthesis cysteine-adding enzyme BshC [Chitinophagaceae bacterium]